MKVPVSDELAERIKSAGALELHALIAFFDAPYLRRQYADLLELAHSELERIRRGQR